MNKRIVSGIDIGSSKIVTIISSIPEQGQMNIIGVSANPSRGIRKGQIVDIEEATKSMVESLEAAKGWPDTRFLQHLYRWADPTWHLKILMGL